MRNYVLGVVFTNRGEGCPCHPYMDDTHLIFYQGPFIPVCTHGPPAPKLWLPYSWRIHMHWSRVESTFMKGGSRGTCGLLLPHLPTVCPPSIKMDRSTSTVQDTPPGNSYSLYWFLWELYTYPIVSMWGYLFIICMLWIWSRNVFVVKFLTLFML